MVKVSFDFDDTMTFPAIATFARWCVNLEHEVWIVTSRLDDDHAPNSFWNVDIWDVARRMEIPLERVVFMNLTPKFRFFQENPDFAFHIDDLDEECEEITSMSTVPAINHTRNPFWRAECERLIHLAELNEKET